jgi:hypothetical protein
MAGEALSMNKTEKKFDVVAMMRSIRNKISAEIEGMTLEEELAWLGIAGARRSFLEASPRQARPTNQHLPRKRVTTYEADPNSSR